LRAFAVRDQRLPECSPNSAQRVPEVPTGQVPPGLDLELPKGQPMDRNALARSLWGDKIDVSGV
jgi:hypothetical protein